MHCECSEWFYTYIQLLSIPSFIDASPCISFFSWFQTEFIAQWEETEDLSAIYIIIQCPDMTFTSLAISDQGIRVQE